MGSGTDVVALRLTINSALMQFRRLLAQRTQSYNRSPTQLPDGDKNAQH